MLAHRNHCYSCQSPVRQLTPASHMSPETPDSSNPNLIHSSSKAAPRLQTLVSATSAASQESFWVENQNSCSSFLPAVITGMSFTLPQTNQRSRRFCPASAFKVQRRLLTGRDRNCTPSHAAHVLAVNWWIINCKTPRRISDRPQWRVIIYEGKDQNTQVSDGKWPNVCVWTETLLYFITVSPPDSYCPVITG